MEGSRSVASVITALRGDPAHITWSDLYLAVQHAQRRAEVSWLVDLIDGLTSPLDASWNPQQHLAQFARRALATVPTYDAAFALVSRADNCSQRPLLAAALAQTHPAATLEQLAALAWRQREARALLSLWMHEAVYLGVDVVALTAPMALRRNGFAAFEGEPVVPLALVSTERALRRTPPGISAQAYGSWLVGDRAPRPEADPRPAATFAAREVTEPAWSDRIRDAYVPRRSVSNAKVEARRFRLDRPLDPAALGAPVLRALSPACVTRGDDVLDESEGLLPMPAEVEVRAGPSSPRELAASLLHAAIGARCYGEYAGVGPGRRRAWSALAALCGLSDDAPWEAVAAALGELRVVTFDADSVWFDHIGDELGFLVLDAEGTTLTLLAATDSD